MRVWTLQMSLIIIELYQLMNKTLMHVASIILTLIPIIIILMTTHLQINISKILKIFLHHKEKSYQLIMTHTP